MNLNGRRVKTVGKAARGRTDMMMVLVPVEVFVGAASPVERNGARMAQEKTSCSLCILKNDMKKTSFSFPNRIEKIRKAI